MEIKADATISYPRALAFRAYRDHLPELVPYLPNVKSIVVKESEDDVGGVKGRTRKFNVWHAKGDVPGPVQAIIKPEMLSWDDHAEWDENAWTTKWRVQTHFFRDRVTCEGTNTYVEQGETTRFSIRGRLEIDLKGLPGVPRLLASSVGGLVEKFIVALLTPNLVEVSKGVEAFLRAKGGKLD